MARLAPTLALCLVLVAGCGGGDDDKGKATASASSAAEVSIESFKFMPKTVKVKTGGSITWSNSDDARHNAQTDDGANGAFDTKDLEQGDSKKLTFDKPGRYSYYCVYHRYMTGTVEVTQ